MISRDLELETESETDCGESPGAPGFSSRRVTDRFMHNSAKPCDYTGQRNGQSTKVDLSGLCDTYQQNLKGLLLAALV